MNKIVIFLTLLIVVSCSTYNIKKDIHEANELNKGGDVAVVIRLSDSSSISHEEILKNSKSWLAGYNMKNEIKFVDYKKELSIYNTRDERFYQESAGKNYLKYKSVGIIKNFASLNKDSLSEIFSKYDVGAVLIFEVGGVYSKSLKAIKFDSVVTVVNEELDITYLDHQKKYIGDGDFDIDNMKFEFLDILSNRLILTLSELGYIEKK